MKPRILPIRRALSALLALLSLVFAAGCSAFDPVVSIGSPSPVITQSAAPEETTKPATPEPPANNTPGANTQTPLATVLSETNGAGAYTIATDVSESKKTYYSEQPDENALRVENGAIAGVDGASVEKRAGDASSLENALQFGLNAAALAHANAQLLLVNSDILSAALGAGGVFAYGGRIQLQNSVVRATGISAYAIAAAGGGSVNARETNLSTQGAESPAIVAAADGSAYVEGGMVVTGGENAPIARAAGKVTISGATLRANNAEAFTINGGSVVLTDCAVSGRMSDAAAGTQSAPYCVALYRDMVAKDAAGSFSMTRGALSAIRGDLFYATNTNASIYLEGVALSLGAGCALLRVSGNDGSRGWGEAGRNGANCTLIAKNQLLSGDIIVDELSSVSVTLRGDSAYVGAINAANTGAAKVTLESGATWTLTDNSYLTAFTGRIGSIVANGFNVFVNGVPLIN